MWLAPELAAPMLGSSSEPGFNRAMDPSLLKSGLLTQALPVLLHKLANQTQLITGFHAILRMDGSEALVEARSPDLTNAGHQVEQVGWLLAALSSGSGHNLMLSRREPRGLVWMGQLVHEVLRKQGVEAAGFGQGFPSMSSKAPEGWRLPWVAGCMLYETYQDGGQAQRPWTFLSEDSGAWVLGLPAQASLHGRMQELAAHLPGSIWAVDAQGMGHLTLPAEWMVSGTPA
ncbi:MAG: hypothetical protein ACI87O_002165 [Planctomycetota bacterium]|jgi:hypothetical protein